MPTSLDRDQILQAVIEIVQEMTADWDTEEGEIKPTTRLIADLGFESIDVVQLSVAIEEKFQRRRLPFEKLIMNNGRYVDEIPVEAVVGFLQKHLDQPAPDS